MSLNFCKFDFCLYLLSCSAKQRGPNKLVIGKIPLEVLQKVQSDHMISGYILTYKIKVFQKKQTPKDQTIWNPSVIYILDCPSILLSV